MPKQKLPPRPVKQTLFVEDEPQRIDYYPIKETNAYIAALRAQVSLSAPRNSALEDAAKEMAEALEQFEHDIEADEDCGEVDCVACKPYRKVRAALARFHALGGE